MNIDEMLFVLLQDNVQSIEIINGKIHITSTSFFLKIIQRNIQAKKEDSFKDQIIQLQSSGESGQPSLPSLYNRNYEGRPQIRTGNADVVAEHEATGGCHYAGDDHDGRDLSLELAPRGSHRETSRRHLQKLQHQRLNTSTTEA